MTQPAFRHNDLPVARERFYEIACDPRRFVAVEACAGAGKTWMLVSRMVRALLETGDAACEPHEILAITFTKKAAGEMRARLDEWLEKFAHLSIDELLPELRMRGLGDAAARDAAPRLQGLYRQLLEGGRPVQIRTFHGWFAGLLRHAPLAVLERLGLPSNYQLLEDDSEARRLVLRPFFTAVIADPEASVDYHALVAIHGRSQTAKALAEALTRRVEFTLADENGGVENDVAHFTLQYPECDGVASPAEWLLAAPAQRELLLTAARALGRASAKTFAAKGVELEAALTAGRAAGVQAALLTLAGEPRKFGEKIIGIEHVRFAQDLVLRYGAAQAQHDAWMYQQHMTRLTRKLITAFGDVKRQQGWVDMNDVEAAAHLLLCDPVLSGWLQERLDARVRHLMIDEFQDTNPMQWQTLYGWLSGYAGAGGRAPSIFLVGDPKQSIYRFRRAEPQVFIAAQRFISEELGGDKLSCDHTHRNALAITGLVNGVMQAAQQAGEFSDFRDHTTESSIAGATLALPLIARDAADQEPTDVERAYEEQKPAWRDSLTTPRVLPEERLLTLECRQAARWIAQRIAGGMVPSDIMVLSRKRSRLAVMQDELRALHIAVQQPEKNDLYDAPEVQDLVALLDVLVSPAHDLALARALKSPLLSVEDDGLVQLAVRQREARKVDAVSTWFELLQAPDLPAELASIGATLLRWKGWVDALPPHDALAAIYHDGDVLARFAAAAPVALRQSMLANLRGLIVASLELDGARYATPYALVRALRAGGMRAPAVASRDAVQLLTVHGAKGLEAGLVLLLDCDNPAQRSQTMGVLVMWPGEKKVPDRFVFVASEKSPSACITDDLATERAARQREELNALYVATTRARTQLVLSGVTAATPNPQSWWSRLSPWCEPIADEAAVGNAASSVALPVAPHFSLPEWPAALAATKASGVVAKPVKAPAEARASAFGQAMHRLLEWARPGVPIAVIHVHAVQREFLLTPAEGREAAAMAERIRAGAAAWVWDTAAIDWHGNEVTLFHAGQTLRIDRLVRHRDSAVWWVLDYKSAARPERDPALIAQIHLYRAAVQSAYPRGTVRSAFLTGQGEMVLIE
jgi:ATP-dependent helicase/nuclease subunit A